MEHLTAEWWPWTILLTFTVTLGLVVLGWKKIPTMLTSCMGEGRDYRRFRRTERAHKALLCTAILLTPTSALGLFLSLAGVQVVRFELVFIGASITLATCLLVALIHATQQTRTNWYTIFAFASVYLATLFLLFASLPFAP